MARRPPCPVIQPLRRHLLVTFEADAPQSGSIIVPDNADTASHIRWVTIEGLGEMCRLGLNVHDRVLANTITAVQVGDQYLLPESSVLVIDA